MALVKKKKNKTVFISGSSSGIGYGIAKRFMELGFEIIINGSNKKNLIKASNSLCGCAYFVSDITNKESIESMVKKIKKKFRKIDYLICNYGNSNFKNNNEDFEYAFKHNFFSSINTIDCFFPLLKKNQSKIICISSICGIEMIKGAPFGYSVAKSAINGFVKAYSSKIANLGISINAIAPGNIQFSGSVWDKKSKKNPKMVKNYIKANVPMNKLGFIEDIFSMCFYILSRSSNFLTGSVFVIDGGQTTRF
jgi:NAD(P)-dependent dehydrogenase (short-subunit alcohol dehydrogenase family)